MEDLMLKKDINYETKNKIQTYTKFLCETRQNHCIALDEIKQLPISLQG
jgi:hypothetical protein